jgi:ADP-ribosylation factor-like protein 2
MGQYISQFTKSVCVKKSFHKVLILGPEGVGKTTIFHRLCSNEVKLTYPTIGFNVDTMKLNNMVVNLWDFGGHEKIMKLWDKYFEYVDLVILVIDSSDSECFDKIKEILKLIKENLSDTYVLIVANKIDLKQQTMSTESIVKNICLYDFGLKIVNFIRCSATTGEGIKEMSKSISSTLTSMN